MRMLLWEEATSLLLVEEEEVLAALTASRQDVCKLVKDVRKRKAAGLWNHANWFTLGYDGCRGV